MNTRSTPSQRPSEGSASAVDAIIGRRAEQQDCAWSGPVRLADGKSALLILLADGMGGATGGRLASTTAIEAFRAHFEADQEQESLKARLQAALDAANDALASAIAANRNLAGMGTTFIGAAVRSGTVTWISVGDSLLIEVVERTVRRLNADHSLAAVLDGAAERGEISHAEAQASAQRNVLRSALTGDHIAMIECEARQLKPGAWLIAATDGVLTLSFGKIGALGEAAKTPAGLARAVLDEIEANMPPDQDNTTLVVTRASRSGSRRTKAGFWPGAAMAGGVVVFLGALGALGVLLSRGDQPINTVVASTSAPASLAPVEPPPPPPIAATPPPQSPPPLDEGPVKRIPERSFDDSAPRRDAPPSDRQDTSPPAHKAVPPAPQPSSTTAPSPLPSKHEPAVQATDPAKSRTSSLMPSGGTGLRQRLFAE